MKVLIRASLLALVLVAEFSKLGFAEDITLFNAPDWPSDEYERRVDSLEPGNRIGVGNGKQYTILRRLGSGGNSVVYDIGNGRAIRLAKTVEDRHHLRTYQAGQAKLSRLGVAVPRIYRRESRVTDFLIVEAIEGIGGGFGASIHTLWMSPPTFKNEPLSEQEARLMRKKFVEFIDSTWRVAYLKDFGEDQLFWDRVGKRWVLLDFEDEIENARKSENTIIYMQGEFETWNWMWEEGWIISPPPELHAALVRIFDRRDVLWEKPCVEALVNGTDLEVAGTPSDS